MKNKRIDVQPSFIFNTHTHLIGYVGKKKDEELNDILERLAPYEQIKLYDVFGGSGAVSVQVKNPVIYNEYDVNFFNLFKQLIDLNNQQELLNALYKFSATEQDDPVNWLNYLCKQTYFKSTDIEKAAILLMFYSWVKFPQNIATNQFKKPSDPLKGQNIVRRGDDKVANKDKPFKIVINIKHYLRNENKKIKLLNMSYENVPIEKNAIYYLDPPYVKTHKNYSKSSFRNDEFFKWVEMLSSKNIKWMMHNDVSTHEFIDKKYFVKQTERVSIITKKIFKTNFYSNF